jgi:hypothetical protein
MPLPGGSRFEFRKRTNVTLHGTSPWHLQIRPVLFVAANVTLHGTSPWHLQISAGPFVAANVITTALGRGIFKELLRFSLQHCAQRSFINHRYSEFLRFVELRSRFFASHYEISLLADR